MSNVKQYAPNTTAWTTLEAVTCCACGTAFGMAKELRESRLQDHKSFYCPNGHSQHYAGETDEEKLRKENKRLAQQRDWAYTARQAADERADAAEKSRAAIKGHQTRLKKRIAAGVCPCCNRSFKDLQAHMAGQHPNYVKEDD
jgi:hypothetical protein